MEEFLYLDVEGIASLYAQLAEETKTASSRGMERSQSVEGKALGTLGLGAILRMLGIGEARVEVELKGDRGRKGTDLTEYRMMPENQMSAVWRYLAGTHALYKDPYEAANAARVIDGGAFCELRAIFQPHANSGIEKWLTAICRTGFVTMEMRDDPGVFFGMSVEKMIGMRPKSKIRNSHFAVRMRSQGHIDLMLLGHMDSTKYVKPYAVAYRR
jgi:hypothetical protein